MYVAYHFKNFVFIFEALIISLLVFFSEVKVTEVAHDYHVSIMKYVTDELGMVSTLLLLF